MRLRPRSRTRDAQDDARNGRGMLERSSPAGVLTTWLRQGLRSGMCPLCRVAHKADREYIWHFYDERSNDMSVIAEVRRARGFCAEHTEMLRRIDVEDMHSTLSISTMFADTFAGIVEDLEALTPAGHFLREQCPACANRDRYVVANADYLLAELATDPGARETFEASPGLCFAHFELVWDAARDDSERGFLRGVQRDGARRLLGELQEHVRKHDNKFRHEPKGAESDSWQRAIFMTSGWPPAAPSAADPEGPR
jgi:hypothetical protein